MFFCSFLNDRSLRCLSDGICFLFIFFLYFIFNLCSLYFSLINRIYLIWLHYFNKVVLYISHFVIISLSSCLEVFFFSLDIILNILFILYHHRLHYLFFIVKTYNFLIYNIFFTTESLSSCFIILFSFCLARRCICSHFIMYFLISLAHYFKTMFVFFNLTLACLTVFRIFDLIHCCV